MKKKTQDLLLAGFISSLFVNIGLSVGTFVSLQHAFSEVKHSKEEETLAKISNNRMLRSRSGFTLPGFTATHLERVTRNADTFGTPWFIPAAVGKIENGGDTLEVGIQEIPNDIRNKFPVLEWQYATLIRMLNKQAWRVILSDPELLSKVIIPFAQNYKAENPQKWLNETTKTIVDYQNIEDRTAGRNEAKTAITPHSVKVKIPSRKNFRKKFRINPKLKH